ncbi:hypothetical protein DNTS_009497, partial [Danionella cerebrum]
YDDIEGQAPTQTFLDNELSLPLLPERPQNIDVDMDTYEDETEKQEDYDDVVPHSSEETVGVKKTEAPVDINSESEAGNAPEEDVLVEVEVHAQVQ